MVRTLMLLALLTLVGCGTATVTVHDGGSGTQAQDGGALDAGADDAGPVDAGPVDAGPTVLNGGDTCAMAPDVTAGGTFAGTTDGPALTDDYGPSGGHGCASGGNASGRDVAYALRPTQYTTYTVTVTPLDAVFDPMLYVQTACGTNECVAATVFNGPGEPESLTFTVPGGQTVFIIVDGELVTKGPFTMTVAQ